MKAKINELIHKYQDRLNTVNQSIEFYNSHRGNMEGIQESLAIYKTEYRLIEKFIEKLGGILEE